MLFAGTDVDRYNTLMDVREADAYLSATGRTASIEALLSVIAKHGTSASVGVRLLHKHNTLEVNESMVEDMFVDTVGFALVTRAVPNATQTGVTATLVPNSWRWTGTRFEPVEFTRSNLLVRADISPNSYPSLFSEIAAVLEREGLTEILGPALNYGDKVSSYWSGDDEGILLERTDFYERANVLRYVSIADTSLANSVETKWEGSLDASGAHITLACRCACSVFPEGGHQGTHFHSR